MVEMLFILIYLLGFLLGLLIGSFWVEVLNNKCNVNDFIIIYVFYFVFNFISDILILVEYIF